MVKNPAEFLLGPMFIGTILNIGLYGITVTQTYLYYSNYKSDRLWFKIIVGLLFIADTMNSVFDLIYIYDSLIVHFADYAYLQKSNWLFSTDPALTGIIAGGVQMFFAWRVQMITGNLWMTAFIVICAMVDLLAGIGTAIAISMVPNYIDFHKFQAVVVVWLVSAIMADITITTCLVWNLRKRKTGFMATDDILNRIIRMTMQTGLLTSLVAAADLITFLTVRPVAVHLIFNMPLSKLYTNSLMSTLNARIGNKYPITGRATSSSANIQSVNVSRLTSQGRPEVYVHVESHQMADKATGFFPEPKRNDEHIWDIKHQTGQSDTSNV